jgi:hypothetical protein
MRGVAGGREEGEGLGTRRRDALSLGIPVCYLHAWREAGTALMWTLNTVILIYTPCLRPGEETGIEVQPIWNWVEVKSILSTHCRDRSVSGM